MARTLNSHFIFVLAVMIALMVLGQGISASQKAELVFHEGFDRPEGGRTLPPKWRFEGEVVADAQTGEGSLLVIDDETHRYSRASISNIDVEPETAYEVSIWFKTDQVENDRGYPAVLIYEDGANGEQLTRHEMRLEHTFDWSLFTFTFTTTEHVETLRMNLYPAYPSRNHIGRGWFDELTVAKINGSDETAANGVELVSPLLNDNLDLQWSLERLISGKGENEVYQAVQSLDDVKISVDRHIKVLGDDAYEIILQYSNYGNDQLLLRSTGVVTIPFESYTWWNGYLNQLLPGDDLSDISLGWWFPANAALDKDIGVALGINPMHPYSRVESNRVQNDDAEKLRIGLPFVLDPGETFELSYVVTAFPARYGHRDVVQTYYNIFPDAYRPADGIHPSAISTQTTYLFWNPRTYGFGIFLEDLTRRFTGGRGGWEWAYAPMVRGGDWATTYEWTEGFRGYTKDRIDLHRKSIQNRLAPAETLDIAPMYYVNVYHAEKTLIEDHFWETVGDFTLSRSWGQETLQGAYPGPNAYGELFKQSLVEIAESFPVSRGIAWDSVFGHQKVWEDVAGVKETPRRSHKNGKIFALQGVAYAELLDLNRSLFSDGYRRANAVNYKLPSPYFVGARTDTSLYEGTPMSLPDRLGRIESMRARLGTQKPLTWHKHLVPEHIPWIDWNSLSSDEIRKAYQQVHQDNLLLSYFWGTIPVPNTPTLGVERTMKAIPELIDLTRQGWQPTPAVDVPGDILVSRFGEGLGSRIAFINPNYEDRNATIVFPSSYWNDKRILLVREDGKELSYELNEDGATLDLKVPAREILLLQVVGVASDDLRDTVVRVRSTYDGSIGKEKDWSFEFCSKEPILWNIDLFWSDGSGRAIVRLNNVEKVYGRDEALQMTLDYTQFDGENQAVQCGFKTLTMLQAPLINVMINQADLEKLQLVPDSGNGGLVIVTPSEASPSVHAAVEKLQQWYRFYVSYVERIAYKPTIQEEISDEGKASMRFVIGESAELAPWEDGRVALVDGHIIEIRARDDAALHATMLMFLNELDALYPYYGVFDPQSVEMKHLYDAGLAYDTLWYEPQTEPIVRPTLLEWLERTRLIDPQN